jgi:hypothetical protein
MTKIIYLLFPILLTSCLTRIDNTNLTPSYFDPTTVALVDGTYYEVPKSDEKIITRNGIDITDKSYIDKIVCFEDFSSDNDYNDLILYIRATKNGKNGNLDLQIKPIAMGATKTIGFGVEVVDKDGVTQGEYKTANCRETFFGGDEGFINTYSKNSEYPIVNEKIKTISGAKCHFYIIVGGRKGYAGVEGKPMNINERPYGIVLLDETFSYPIENNSIEDVYVGSNTWFDGTNEDYKFDTPTGNFITITGKPNFK